MTLASFVERTDLATDKLQACVLYSGWQRLLLKRENDKTAFHLLARIFLLIA